MNFIARIALALFFLFAAIACYVFGIPAGGIAFLVFGLVLEGLFGFILFRKTKQSQR